MRGHATIHNATEALGSTDEERQDAVALRIAFDHVAVKMRTLRIPQKVVEHGIALSTRARLRRPAGWRVNAAQRDEHNRGRLWKDKERRENVAA